MIPDISIIVPTLNEAPNIDPLIAQIEAVCLKARLACEILVVDDGSDDGTQERVLRLQPDHPVRLLERDREKGLAGAVLHGARNAAAEMVLVMDADLSHPPEAIPELAAPIQADRADMAIGSRYVPGGSTPGWSPARRLLSRFATLFSWPLTEVQDPLSGLFAVRRDRLLSIESTVSGFKIGLELIAQAGESLRVVEIPIAFHDRERGQSKFGFGAGFAYLGQLARLLGGSASGGSALRFGAVGLLGMALDISLFSLLLAYGVSLGAAHAASFLLATINNYLLNAYWTFRGETGANRVTSVTQYALFLVVAVLALCLRGGVLAALTGGWGWSPQLAILPAVAVAAAVNYFGAAWLVFPASDSRLAPELKWNLITWAVVGYLLCLRLFYLGGPELLKEEAYYWTYAQHLDIGYLDHPPMVAWLIWLSTKIFGTTEFAVRFPAWLSWLIASVFVFKLSKNLYGGGVARRSLLVFAVLPVFFIFGFMMTPDAPLIPCWAAALYYLERALRGNRNRAWLGVGAAFGLGLLCKYTIGLLGLATLVYVLLDRPSRHWLLRPEPYLGAALTVALFSPVIVWNARHEWISFAFQSTRRVHGAFRFSLPQLVASILVLLTPTGFLAAGCALAGSGAGPSVPAGPLLHETGDADRARNRRLFVLVYALVPLGVFVLFSLSKTVKLNWTGPLWIVLIPWMAANICSGRAPIGPDLLKRVYLAWPATVAVIMLGLAVMLHALTLGFPLGVYPTSSGLLGWHDLTGQIEQIADRVERETGQEPIVVGMSQYGITAHLGFYRTRILENRAQSDRRDALNTTAGRHLLGLSAVMYEYWQPRPVFAGSVLILVGDDQDDLTKRSTARQFEHLGEVHEIIARKEGSVVSTFYYRVGRLKR